MLKCGKIFGPKKFQKWYLNNNDFRVDILRTTNTLVYYKMNETFDMEHMSIKHFIKIYSRRL